MYLKEQFHFQTWKVSHTWVSPDPSSTLHPKVKISFLQTGQKAAASVVAREFYFEGQVGTTLHLTGFSSSDYTVPCFLEYVIISFWWHFKYPTRQIIAAIIDSRVKLEDHWLAESPPKQIFFLSNITGRMLNLTFADKCSEFDLPIKARQENLHFSLWLLCELFEKNQQCDLYYFISHE